MQPPEKKAMDLAEEVSKLRLMLTLPVTHIEFDDRYEYGRLYVDGDNKLTTIYAKLYCGDCCIGELPYMMGKWGPMYILDTREKLNWLGIYILYKDGFEAIVKQKQPLAATILPYGYKRLVVKDDNDETINYVYFDFINDEWQLVLSGLNVEQKTETVEILLSPPLPSDEI